MQLILYSAVGTIIVIRLVVKYLTLREELKTLSKQICALEKRKFFTEEQALCSSERENAVLHRVNIEAKMLILENRADLLQYCLECPLYREKVRADMIRQTAAKRQ